MRGFEALRFLGVVEFLGLVILRAFGMVRAQGMSGCTVQGLA